MGDEKPMLAFPNPGPEEGAPPALAEGSDDVDLHERGDADEIFPEYAAESQNPALGLDSRRRVRDWQSTCRSKKA